MAEGLNIVRTGEPAGGGGAPSPQPARPQRGEVGGPLAGSLAQGVAPGAVLGDPQASGEAAIAEAVLAFETLMVQSMVASGFAQQNLLRNLPGNDVGGKIQKMRTEEEERMRELEQEIEEMEREAERG